uniref:RNA-dependent RNA polymerase n=1 Tax=Grapevine-associated botourmia-like virus 5 TaxID=2814349 RepID=A0A8F6C7Z0_9VIRU|nr:MAG: RNA-dependent RNA polymerase [Grapevine-associated botourmia-like virus 5]
MRSIASIFRFTPEMVIDVKRFHARLAKLLVCNGWNFLFSYMKEGIRLTARRLLTGQISTSLGKPFVRLDKDGYPAIIPKNWRVILKRNDPSEDRYIIGILTILTIFRCFPTKVKESFDSITSPFTGVCKTLDPDLVSRALYDLGITKSLKLKNMKFITLTSAGPNTKVSMWGSLIDMMSLVRQPQLWILCHKYITCLPFKISPFLTFFYIYSFILLPFYPIMKLYSYTSQIVYKIAVTCCYAFGIFSSIETKPSQYSITTFSWLEKSKLYRLASGPFHQLSLYSLFSSVNNRFNLNNGKLAIVYDQAGKARVVAMTNYWIQCLFKPIHDSLFDFLRTIDFIDGTFNQEGCIRDFMDRANPSQTIYSFDLSAATDRLPIDLQVQILGIIFENASMSENWRAIIQEINWYFKGLTYKYSVGQPMGAYSSWAMLAMTHHVIVRVASLRCNLEGFSDYLVLGDDIIIANDDVAAEYRNIMSLLGLEINLQKSMIGKNSCEFAKKWMIGQRDLSPIGAKLLLQSIRSRDSMFLILTDLLRRKLVTLSGIPVIIENLGSRFRSLETWALYALISGFMKIGEEVRYQYEDTGYGINRFDPTSGFPLGYNTKENLINNYLNEVILQDRKASATLENIIRNWRNVDFYRSSGLRLWGFFNLLNPALYLTLKPLFKHDECLWQNISWVHKINERPESYEVLYDLRSLVFETNILDIDFKDKVVVSDLRASTWTYVESLDIQSQDALSYWVALKRNVSKWHDIQSGIRPPETGGVKVVSRYREVPKKVKRRNWSKSSCVLRSNVNIK